ncbi:Xylose isomerase-like TIM barrel [compost metagenome]
MKKMFLMACAGRGIQPSSKEHPVSEEELSVDTQFRLVKEAGIWDFFDRIPTDDNLDEFVKAIEKYDVPVLSGSWTYQLGKDEAVITANLQRAKQVDSKYHNLMIWARHADGHMLSNQEIVASYLDVYAQAERLGITITYEVHVDMWSEDVRRVTEVAEEVRKHGVPFNFCMDYSHCIFKIENEVEQAVSGIRRDAEARRRLDPFNGDSFCDEWLAQNMVHWTQVRPAAPNGPRNWLAFESGPFDGIGYGRPGRSIQYPFRKPGPDEWLDTDWHAYKLSCTKEALRKVIDDYIGNPDSEMRIMTIDNINLSAYGVGWKYNMYEDSCELGRYVRELYAERMAVAAAREQAGSTAAFIHQYRP